MPDAGQRIRDDRHDLTCGDQVERADEHLAQPIDRRHHGRHVHVALANQVARRRARSRLAGIQHPGRDQHTPDPGDVHSACAPVTVPPPAASA